MDNPLSVTFYDSEPKDFVPGFVVLVSRFEGQWVLVRHCQRGTYEVPGGHIEPGEEPDVAAKRELFEETGAVEYDLRFVAYYTVKVDGKLSGGCLYFADIITFTALPAYEIAERTLFEHLPENLTYPQIQPFLHQAVENWLNHLQAH